MNHKRMTLGVAAIAAVAALKTSAFAIPQPALAHYSVSTATIIKRADEDR
jgi:hypothetical protein